MRYLFILYFVVANLSQGSALSTAEPDGWLWYKESTTQKEKKPSPLRKKKKNPLEEVKTIREQFEQATATALMNPSFDNVHKAQRLQTELINRAEAFSKMWQWVVLQDAYHWREAGHGNRVHREIYKEEEQKKLNRNLQKLSKSFGLFLFFKESCPYCHAFAPIVKTFAENHGFVIKAVSEGRGNLKEFPSSVMDNGTIRKLNPEGIFPALFLINPTTQEVIPLSWGMNSLSVLEQQASLIFENRKDIL